MSNQTLAHQSSPLFADLTGTSPQQTSETTAGVTWTLKTPYYTVTLPIWIDEIPTPSEWSTEFSKPEAREVISCLGAWIYVFKHPVTTEDLETVKETMKAIKKVIEKATGYEWEGTLLAVGMQQSITPRLQMPFDEWDELCRDFGFEYIDATAKGRNEFGEPVGIPRLKEALETTEWDNGDDELGLEDLDEGDGLGDDGEWGDFAREEEEMGVELLGLKSAIHAAEGEEDEDEAVLVEEMGKLMGRLQAIKGITSSHNILIRSDRMLDRLLNCC
jgi:hypothetical protein